LLEVLIITNFTVLACKHSIEVFSEFLWKGRLELPEGVLPPTILGSCLRQLKSQIESLLDFCVMLSTPVAWLILVLNRFEHSKEQVNTQLSLWVKIVICYVSFDRDHDLRKHVLEEVLLLSKCCVVSLGASILFCYTVAVPHKQLV